MSSLIPYHINIRFQIMRIRIRIILGCEIPNVENVENLQTKIPSDIMFGIKYQPTHKCTVMFTKGSRLLLTLSHGQAGNSTVGFESLNLV